jgi:hypothetical protein
MPESRVEHIEHINKAAILLYLETGNSVHWLL